MIENIEIVLKVWAIINLSVMAWVFLP